MNIKKIEIFDDDNNLYYPKTSADNIIFNNSLLSDFLSKLNGNTGSSSGNSTIIKKVFNNVTANNENIFTVSSSDNVFTVNVFKGIDSDKNIDSNLKTLNSDTKQDFIKNEDEINIDNNGGNIINKYIYNFTNESSIYKSSEININEYKILNGITLNEI